MLTLEELNRGFSLGGWEVLPAQRTLQRGEQVERPEPMVFDVLLALARRNGDLVTKDELVEEVWHGRPVSDEVIQQKVAQLRKHFADQRAYRYVGTLPRRGYQLLQPVVLHEDSPAVSHKPQSHSRWKAVAAAIVLGFLVIAWLVWPRPDDLADLAILPIENLSGDPNNLYIAEGIKNTLAQRLNELPDRTIRIARTVYQDPWPVIADELRVATLLVGSVQLQNDILKIDYNILDRDGTQIAAGEVTGELSDLFDLQEKLARQVRAELAGDDGPELITKQAPDSAGYNSYMRGMYKLEHRLGGTNLEDAIELFQESIQLDASYGPAYLGLATAYALMPDYRGADLETYHHLAIETIERGVARDGSISDPAGAIYGFVYYQQKQWLEAEKNYRRAVSAPVVDSNAFSWYSMMLANVGRMEKSRDMALAAEALDPDNGVVNSRVAMVYTWLNNTAKAYEYFDRANDLDATGELHDISYAFLLARTGQLEMSRNLTFSAVEDAAGETEWIDPVFAALTDGTPELTEAALAAVRDAWEKRHISPEMLLISRVLLGDTDGAMEVARLLERPGLLFSMEILFVPELAPLRKHPDFLPLLDRMGVVRYWDSVGCRWQDDHVDCDD
jgi:DNA-binding winged helix-turn-helix (wHTH) protein/tetratricopeptide (TPR) repeat protein